MSEDLRVELVDELNYTPATLLATAGWLEVEQAGFGDGVLNIGGVQKAVLAYLRADRDEVPVGVITFQVDGARIWLCQSYVVPEYRGRGIYTAMWAKLYGHAQENLPNVRVLLSATHLRNDTMRKVARRLGREETGVILETRIQR